MTPRLGPAAGVPPSPGRGAHGGRSPEGPAVSRQHRHAVPPSPRRVLRGGGQSALRSAPLPCNNHKDGSTLTPAETSPSRLPARDTPAAQGSPSQARLSPPQRCGSAAAPHDAAALPRVPGAPRLPDHFVKPRSGE